MLLDLVALLVALTALLSFANARFLRLPSAIGLLATALLSSLSLKLLALAGLLDLGPIVAVVAQVDFRATLLEGMLGLLLFAGALHIDASKLRTQALAVGLLATVGIAVGAGLIAALLVALAPLVGLAVPWGWALAFGVLIAPTDPIAVGAILRKAGVPVELQKTITGESLFNDGTAVVLFLVALAGLSSGEAPAAPAIARLLAVEVGGGLLFGVGLGLLAVWMLRQLDDYLVETLLSLAFVLAGFTLARHLHVSGVLGMVVLGLVVGSRGRQEALSARTQQRLDDFWELVDEFLNAVLFVLIGVEVLLLELQPAALLLGALMIPATLLARAASVAVSLGAIKSRLGWPVGSFRLLTWAGVRGGISIALALALPDTPLRATLLTVTYVIVCFSILVQGLTIELLARRLLPRPTPSA